MKHLINKTQTNVSLMEGKILIEVSGSVEISDKDAENEHVSEAIRRGWVELADEASTSEKFKPAFEFSTPDVVGSSVLPKKKTK